MKSIRVVYLAKFIQLVNERAYQKSGSQIPISCCFIIGKLFLFVGTHMPPHGNHHHLCQSSLSDLPPVHHTETTRYYILPSCSLGISILPFLSHVSWTPQIHSYMRTFPLFFSKLIDLFSRSSHIQRATLLLSFFFQISIQMSFSGSVIQVAPLLRLISYLFICLFSFQNIKQSKGIFLLNVFYPFLSVFLANDICKL